MVEPTQHTQTQHTQTQHTQTKTDEKLAKLVEVIKKSGPVPYTFSLHGWDGAHLLVGEGEPAFEIRLNNKTAYDAAISLHELLIAEAYMNGDIDLEGDLIKIVLSFQDRLSDRHMILKSWRLLKPLIWGREKCNPEWIAKHYDANNLQLLGIENRYDTYTPGIYLNDEEEMDTAAERKLAFAFEALQLPPQAKVLDIGSGWGGFLRYAAARDMQVTGITLSKHQAEYVEKLIAERNFSNAQVFYQDFFTYQPPEKFDGITMMGVIEDLSDYKRVMKKLPDLLKPGGRVYLDFASEKQSFSTHSFVTKHIWPGTFRMVYMPEFIDAIRLSMLEIHGIYDDRHNYHLWAKKAYEKLLQNKAPFVEQSNEYLWRMFLILYASVSASMIKPDYDCTAYRVVLYLPHDHKALG